MKRTQKRKILAKAARASRARWLPESEESRRWREATEENEAAMVTGRTDFLCHVASGITSVPVKPQSLVMHARLNLLKPDVEMYAWWDSNSAPFDGPNQDGNHERSLAAWFLYWMSRDPAQQREFQS